MSGPARQSGPILNGTALASGRSRQRAVRSAPARAHQTAGGPLGDLGRFQMNWNWPKSPDSLHRRWHRATARRMTAPRALRRA